MSWDGFRLFIHSKRGHIVFKYFNINFFIGQSTEKKNFLFQFKKSVSRKLYHLINDKRILKLKLKLNKQFV